MGVAAAVRHEHVVRHERETHREAGEGSTVPRRGGQLYSGWAVNSISTARQVFETQGQMESSLIQEGGKRPIVPSSHRPIKVVHVLQKIERVVYYYYI